MKNVKILKGEVVLLLTVVLLCVLIGISERNPLIPGSVFAAEVVLDDGDEVPKADGAATAGTPLPDGTAVPLAAAPAAGTGMEIRPVGTAPAMDVSQLTVASGKLVKKNGWAEVDYSNTADGYIMVRYTGPTSKKLKVQVRGATTTYTYTLKAGEEWTTFPLSDGNSYYSVTIYENIRDSRYSKVMSAGFNVELKDEFGPFLRPNQYVNYASSAENTVAKAAELCSGITDPLKKVQVVYDFVVGNLRYNYPLAATVQSGYLPVLDRVLASQKGICFDYAAMMTAMLRTQGVPCKLVVGYAGTAYHAWISVWTEQQGWVENVVYFDGSSWQRMDPTFASTGKQSRETMEFIGNGANYTAKYLY